MTRNNLEKNIFYWKIVNSIILLFYILIWLFLFYAVHDRGPYDTGPVYMLFIICIMYFFSLPCLIIYSVLLYKNKTRTRKDYLAAVIITILPIVLLFIDIKSGNLK